jgi:CMD domain protein
MSAAYDPSTDLVDRLAGLPDGSALHALRQQRDKVARATQGSYDALFDPALPGLPLTERLLVALYAARLTPAAELAEHFLEQLTGRNADARSIAAASTGTPDDAAGARLRALLTFTRRLIERPIEGDQAALQALLGAGVDTADAVALAQLIAFLSYQARLVAGLVAMQVDGRGDAERRNQRPAPPAAGVLEGVLPGERFTSESLGWKAWLPVVDLASATPEQITVLEESHPQAKTSEYYLALVHQPEILRQRSAVFNAIMYAPGGLPRAERELGATATSRINGCVYCASVHAQRFEQLARRRDAIEQLFADPNRAGTTPRERAIVRFSIALTRSPANVSGADVRALREVGLSPLEVLDLIHAVAIFAWANRLMLNLGEPVRGA